MEPYPWSWVVKHSLISNWRRYGHLRPSFSIQRYVYCNILQSRSICIKKVFLAGGCFLNGQWTSFASEESHPQMKLKCIKMLNWTLLGVVVLVGAVDLASQTCTLPRLESAAGFVQVGIQRHLFGYPGAGPGSWKRLDCAIIQLWFNIPISPFQDLYFNLFRNIIDVEHYFSILDVSSNSEEARLD